MYTLPPGFGSADEADRHLGLTPSASTELGAAEQSFIAATSPLYFAAGGFVMLGGVGGILGAQKDIRTALIAGAAAALVGGVGGYFMPALVKRMAGK